VVNDEDYEEVRIKTGLITGVKSRADIVAHLSEHIWDPPLQSLILSYLYGLHIFCTHPDASALTPTICLALKQGGGGVKERKHTERCIYASCTVKSY
jgi:hypothetical protein